MSERETLLTQGRLYNGRLLPISARERVLLESAVPDEDLGLVSMAATRHGNMSAGLRPSDAMRSAVRWYTQNPEQFKQTEADYHAERLAEKERMAR